MPSQTDMICEECPAPAEYRIWGEHYDYVRLVCAAHKAWALRMTEVDLPSGIPVHCDPLDPPASEDAH